MLVKGLESTEMNGASKKYSSTYLTYPIHLYDKSREYIRC